MKVTFSMPKGSANLPGFFAMAGMDMQQAGYSYNKPVKR